MDDAVTAQGSRRVVTIALLAVAVLGLGFIAVGFYLRSALTADSGDIVVQGFVVDTESSTRTERDTDGDRYEETMYLPVVEFIDPGSGLPYTVTGTLESSSEPEIGSTRDVSFPPGNPTDAKVIGSVWFAWIFVVLGVGALGLAAFGILSSRRSEATAARRGSEHPGTFTVAQPQDAIRTETFDETDDLDGPQDEIRD